MIGLTIWFFDISLYFFWFDFCTVPNGGNFYSMKWYDGLVLQYFPLKQKISVQREIDINQRTYVLLRSAMQVWLMTNQLLITTDAEWGIDNYVKLQ